MVADLLPEVASPRRVLPPNQTAVEEMSSAVWCDPVLAFSPSRCPILSDEKARLFPSDIRQSRVLPDMKRATHRGIQFFFFDDFCPRPTPSETVTPLDNMIFFPVPETPWFSPRWA